MLLKYFYDDKLAHASYMVGCQRSQTALIVDPGRDITPYLAAAAKEGFTVSAVAETHIHADYVSGARELAEQAGAKLYVSDEGPAEWKYEYLESYQHQLLKDGDTFKVGKIKLQTLHTPGHTPESISFLLTDEGGGANEPMGIFTGDFVFVGSIGRPDLLEEAAGIQGSAEQGAHALFHSVERFKRLPDHIQVWPAHGAGSACGKGLGAIPSSTVGYEKLFNPSLQYDDENAFVDYILSDQPEAPKYFAVMKRVNKVGPALLSQLPQVKQLPAIDLQDALSKGMVLDLTASPEYARRHVPGSINIPVDMLAGWAGWIVDYEEPLFLVAEQSDTAMFLTTLRKLGIDNIRGIFDRSNLVTNGLAAESYESQTPADLASVIEQASVQLIDVRSEAEWNEGHIGGAQHYFLGKLQQQLGELTGKTIVTQCQAGARSAIAASMLQAAGHEVIDMQGGLEAWLAAKLPVPLKPSSESSTGETCQVG